MWPGEAGPEEAEAEAGDRWWHLRRMRERRSNTGPPQMAPFAPPWSERNLPDGMTGAGRSAISPVHACGSSPGSKGHVDVEVPRPLPGIGGLSAGAVIIERIESIALSASCSSSALVRFWIGCGTHTMPGWKPRERDWLSTASANSVVTTKQPGIPLSSKSLRSCRPHDVQDPQSANAWTTTFASVAMRCRSSTGARRAFVGLSVRIVSMPRASRRVFR